MEINGERKKIKKLLEFQAQFTKLEWYELNTQIQKQYSKKAGQLQLDDSDIKDITNRLDPRRLGQI